MNCETVDQLIERVMAQHPGHGTPKLQLEYFEAVHQELAPMARDLEAENHRLHAQMQSDWAEAGKRVLAEREALCAELHLQIQGVRYHCSDATKQDVAVRALLDAIGAIRARSAA